MNSIDTRLAAISAEVERRRMIQSEPIDALSVSLFAFEEEIAGLDEIGIAALAAETTEDGRQILTLEQARKMVDTYRQEVTEQRMSAFRAGARV